MPETAEIDLSVLRRPVVKHWRTGEPITHEGHKPEFLIGSGEPVRCSRDDCTTPIVYVMWRNEHGERYSTYSHVNGVEECGEFVWPRSRCPKCKTYDAIKTTQEAYGDRVECTAPGCGYENWHSIGD